jgi:hypothetical protein
MCGSYPSPRDLLVENNHWQVLETSDGTFKIFNAYYDKRNYNQDDPVVRILALVNRVKPKVKTFCQFWYKDITAPFSSETHEYKMLWKERWGINSKGYSPFMVTCRDQLADLGFVPVSVSLVENRCDNATNHLDVIYNFPLNGIKKPFAVCVKQLNFLDDQTMQLIEWVEILSIHGADKIFIYVSKLHPNMIRTMKYYESIGKVKVEMSFDAAGIPSRNESMIQWFHNEMIPLNDCLYKHMYEYDYLVPLDIDEVVMPKHKDDKTWQDLLKRIKSQARLIQNETYSAYVARNVFFLFDNNHENETHSEIPANMVFLQHIYRAESFSQPEIGVKSFQDTNRVFSMHNHMPMQSIEGNEYDLFDIKTDDAQVQHYRKGCENYPKQECDDFKQNTVKDSSLWKIKDEIIANVNKTLEALHNWSNEYDSNV